MAAALESALVSGSTFPGVTGAIGFRNAVAPTTDAMIVVGSFSDRTAQGYSPVLSGQLAGATSAPRTQRCDLTPSALEQLSAELFSE